MQAQDERRGNGCDDDRASPTSGSGLVETLVHYAVSVQK